MAGSPYKTLVPSGWNGPGPDVECINLIQTYKFTNKEPHLDYKNPQNVQLVEVATIDGVWFCVPKVVALKHPFDAMMFKGFHSYDIDSSLSIGTIHQVAVTYEVLLTYLSEGNYSRAWLQDILSLHKKWKKMLPVNKGHLAVNSNFAGRKYNLLPVYYSSYPFKPAGC